MAQSIMIMAGGTGGHVYPALAVAEELRARGWTIFWLGTPDSFESRVVPSNNIVLDTIDSFRLRGQGVLSTLLAPMRLLKALWQARGVLSRRRPNVVLGMGGFASGPGGLMAALMRKPLVVHEQNAIPGMTNRWLAKLAKRVLEAFPYSFESEVGAIAVGNPVRSAINATQREELDAERKLRLLIVGGSLGAAALNEKVPQALAALEESIRPEVRHQAGRNKLEQTMRHYADNNVEADVREYLEDMAAAYAWADLVICRSGALTVTELTSAALPAILVPYPHAVDDHQTENARFLVDANAAVLMPQNQMSAEKLATHLKDLLADPAYLQEMGTNAAQLARPDAAKKVADICEEVAL